ncbi:SIS domain-containing protein [Gemmatimonas sp.]|jgi:D-sedoheptulose 7-phosphate isomerase|uniref:SIS domain-containing protein n=1 Tax=Gemmatimonas sp. TaxID=1962908 RepID=UPI0037BEA1F7
MTSSAQTTPGPVTPLLDALRELAATAERSAVQLEDGIARALDLVKDTVAREGTLLFCGNGGSAADAQHMATEYVVRYMRNRRPYPAIALTTDSSLLTATGNDFGFDHVFERQVQAIGKPGDLLIIHSTSGNSPNVLLAADAARAKGMPVLALTAKDGGALKHKADVCIVVPTSRTDRAQEIHLCIQHAICDAIEATL